MKLKYLVCTLGLVTAISGRAAVLSDFIGNYHLGESNHAACYPNLLIEQGIGSEHPEKGLVTIVGQPGFPFITFYEVNEEGYYSFNSSISEWTYTENNFRQDIVTKKEARAYFFKPLKIFAKKVASLTWVNAQNIRFEYPVLPAGAQKTITVNCTYLRN